MERTGNGGFQGYRKLPTITPASSSSEMNLRVTSEMNHNMINGNNHNNGNLNGNYNLDQKEECTVREQDRFMPIANVIRIMRKILPSHAKISDDAKETIQECVSEYISFVTSEANERCQQEQRKTITAEDVLFAMSKLGFDDYIEPLTLYLHRYRELEGEQRSSIRDPLPLKRNANGVLEFAPPNYHHHHHHHHAFFGAGGAIGMGGGYVGHASNNNATSSSGAADPIFPQSK